MGKVVKFPTVKKKEKKDIVDQFKEIVKTSDFFKSFIENTKTHPHKDSGST